MTKHVAVLDKIRSGLTKPRPSLPDIADLLVEVGKMGDVDKWSFSATEYVIK
jgi:hypothetical protein